MTTNVLLVSKLRMNGTITPLRLYDFMAYIATTVPLPLQSSLITAFLNRQRQNLCSFVKVPSRYLLRGHVKPRHISQHFLSLCRMYRGSQKSLHIRRK